MYLKIDWSIMARPSTEVALSGYGLLAARCIRM